MIYPKCVVPVVALLIAVAVVGCAGPSEPAAPPDPFPPRPQAIDIEQLDPCELLTAEQLAPLGLGSEDSRSGTPQVSGLPTRACDWWNLQSDFGQSIQLIPLDAEQVVGSSGAEVGSIDGYGTVRITDRETNSPLCEIYVDVNDGQVVRIQARATAQTPDGAPLSAEATCQRAEGVAQEALRTARVLVS